MRERRQILDLWRRVSAAGEEAVLATVVRTQGSSYRLPGARLLLTRTGQRAGGVSGGCLEDDIAKKSWWLTENGPIVRRYDTTPDGELATDGYGLGCNGIIHVLLERLTPGDPSVLPVLETVARERREIDIEHRLTPGEEIFRETLAPPLRLLLFGAGDDAMPLVEAAHALGWEVAVYDGRSHYARREKFPLAEQVTVRAIGSPAPAIDRWTAAAIMTHSFSQDADILRSLATEPLRYLGVLGPCKRTNELLADIDPSAPALAGLHAPMGLDIGADGPEQVALAVTAEIQAVFTRRAAGFLREASGSIHQDGTWERSIACA